MTLRLMFVTNLLVLAVLPAMAAPTSPVASSQTTAAQLDARGQGIAARLRCPVCQNESVADSPADLAGQMRALIRQKLDAGETDDQIITYFVGKYGEWILLDPPRRGLLWLFWLAPAVTLVIGSLLAWGFLRKVTPTRRKSEGHSATGLGAES